MTKGSEQALIRACFPAEMGAVRATLLTVDARLDQRGVSTDLRACTQIALAEACNNIVEHAYRATPTRGGMIGLDIVAHRRGLQITLCDRGQPMPQGRLPNPRWPPIDAKNLRTWPEGGFGWPILRGIACCFHLSRRDGQNVLRFVLPKAAAPGKKQRNAL